jgi:hypothetical protein
MRDSDKVDTLPGKVFTLGTNAVLSVSKVEVNNTRIRGWPCLKIPHLNPAAESRPRASIG